MTRTEMILCIGKEYHTSNIEGGEYSYVQEAGSRAKLEKAVGHPVDHFKLDIDKWKDFQFGNLISKIYKAKAHNKDDLTETSNSPLSIRYITRTGENNGCELIVSINGINSNAIEEANAITIGDTTATCFYQDEKFITGDHMVVIRAEWLNKARALFILSILKKEQYKYSYGRAFLMDRIKSTTLKLPIVHNEDGTPYIDKTYKFSDEGYVPDWTFMENYIKSLPYGDRI